MNWILGIASLVVVGFLLDREIYFYEGVHLGPRLQAWLYDRWSRKYDEGKRASQLRDDEMLAQPLLDAWNALNIPSPFVLDFATGTGRLSVALSNRQEFTGHIVALDLSQGMLEQALAKLSGSRARVDFLRHIALPLPFPDASFDTVCALEVLELFPGMNEPLAELTRVLRPGGVLLTSRGTEESGRKAKVKNAREFMSLLERYDLEHVQITKWWTLFDRVIAIKRGSSQPVPATSLAEVLRCSSCHASHWNRLAGAMKCDTCGRELSITRDAIVLNE